MQELALILRSGNVMGEQSVGNINSNGHRLLSLYSEFGVFVTNTLSPTEVQT